MSEIGYNRSPDALPVEIGELLIDRPLQCDFCVREERPISIDQAVISGSIWHDGRNEVPRRVRHVAAASE